ncbi:putative gamma-tubulin complex component 2 [Neospora caninum Liverpool]|uniref:Gamma-tubulin complex component 2, putative n=1 Tax=Neospora caninum (strain Liverpool) TaxID=572307 RepID=F0VG11_NEOCL|nr:putative gamma-tubulin complex component 2 [Neospora caninum Liverpool]CBZ52655.1 putative gamma-tubulin complex component 2 [Neospora caninum Liverpool]CEL66632.1 TPA: gamma-tubulin complex component 2, putative [Neospora caninum Liverpool]|eukprot:XP_003882687.1 putative gamma-tubulin complex component 2 [Neospora caninum Liverpool]
MPLPPLAGSLAYGAQVGLRSTLDASRSAKQPYYISLGDLSGQSSPCPAFPQSSFASLEKVTAPSTPFSSVTKRGQVPPSPFPAPLPSTDSASSTHLLPLCCTATHPYRPLCSSEFSLLRASSPVVGDVVHADEEVLLVAGLPRSFPLGPGNGSQNVSGSEESREGILSQTRTQLWLLCCPRRTEIRQFAQRLHSSRPGQSPSPPVGSSGTSTSPSLPAACALFGAPDEEDVGVVCARGVVPDGSVKSLLTRVDRRCRWRLLRATPGTCGGVEQSRGSSESVSDPDSANADGRSGSARSPPSSVLHLDEEILLQNCHTGQFLSLRISDNGGDAQNSARLVAVGKPAFASSASDEDREKRRPSDPGFFRFPSGSRLSQFSSASCRGAVKASKPLFDSEASPPCMHSGWRLVPAGVRVAPSWDRVVPHSLLGPSEIDDSLLKREKFLGVPLASFISNASPFANPPLSLSPYVDEPTLQASAQEREGAAGDPSLRVAAADRALAARFSVSGAARSSATGASVRPSLAESWRSVGAESLGENDWVMRRLHADWSALSREVKERFLLEDLLFCLSGLDGTLIRILAISSQVEQEPASTNAPGSPPRPAPSASPDPPLPSFHYWLHPLLRLGGQSPDFGELSRVSTDGDDRSTSLVPGLPGSSGPPGPFHASESRGGHAFALSVSQAASEDAALSQMLPPLLPAACSLRLLLVFLELAGRRNSASKASVVAFGSSTRATSLSGWGGEIAEAFCGAIKKIVEELGIRVGVWEGEIRRGRLTLQGLRAQLGPVARALGVAEAVVREAWGKRGGELLDAAEEVKKRLPCNDANQEICRFIFEKAAAPLARIVENWVHHGVLQDTYGEFFIREDPTVVAEGEPTSEWRGASLAASLSGVATSGSSLDQPWTDFRPCAGEWCRRRFVLVESLVPNSLKPHARDIHRAGLYVYVLNSCSYTGLPPPASFLPADGRPGASPSLSPRLLPLLPAACARASSHLMHFFFHSLELPRTLELLHDFFLVGRADFLQHFFEFAAPADGALCAGSGAPGLSGGVTWHATLQEIAGLEGCMEQAIRSVSGLETLKEKISFFMHPVPSLCEAAQLLAHAHEEDNLRTLLGLSKSSGVIGGEGTTNGNSSTPFRRPSPSEWCRRVCLRYRCGWPLSLLYTSKALCGYELVFRLLLHLHLAHRQLNQLWMHIHETRSLFSFADMPVHLRQTVAIGEEMRIFTRNLLFYATTDVIALHYSALRRHLQSLSSVALACSPASGGAASPTYSFADVQELHARFLSCLLRDLFLEDLGLLQAASKCLTICLVFSRHVRKFSFDPPDFPLLSTRGLLASTSLAPKSDAAGEAERGLSETEPREARNACENGAGAQAKAPGMNSRERIRAARRQQVRATVDSAGFGGMVRSAGTSFRENFAEFLSKLEAFSNRFPASPSAHLLFRFNFNDCLSARSRAPSQTASVSRPSQARMHPSSGEESVSGLPPKTGVWTGDREAAPVSSWHRGDKLRPGSPPLLPPSRALSSHAREKSAEEGNEEGLLEREGGWKPRQPSTPRQTVTSVLSGIDGPSTSRRTGAFERPPPFPETIATSLRQGGASASSRAGEGLGGRGVSASPFQVPSSVFSTGDSGRSAAGQSRTREGADEEEDGGVRARERFSVAGGKNRTRDLGHASDEGLSDEVGETYSVVSEEDGEDEDFDAALRSFQERIRGEGTRGARDRKARKSFSQGGEEEFVAACRSSESDSEDFHDTGDIDGSEEERSSLGDDAGSEDEPRRRRDSAFSEEFYDEDGNESLLDEEEGEPEPRIAEKGSAPEHHQEEGYAAAFLRSRDDVGR